MKPKLQQKMMFVICMIAASLFALALSSCRKDIRNEDPPKTNLCEILLTPLDEKMSNSEAEKFIKNIRPEAIVFVIENSKDYDDLQDFLDRNDISGKEIYIITLENYLKEVIYYKIINEDNTASLNHFKNRFINLDNEIKIKLEDPDYFNLQFSDGYIDVQDVYYRFSNRSDDEPLSEFGARLNELDLRGDVSISKTYEEGKYEEGEDGDYRLLNLLITNDGDEAHTLEHVYAANHNE